MEAVVAGQHNQGIVEQASTAQGRQNPADQGVDVTDGGVVAVEELEGLLPQAGNGHKQATATSR
jgi:hypothetical protein